MKKTLFAFNYFSNPKLNIPILIFVLSLFLARLGHSQNLIQQGIQGEQDQNTMKNHDFSTPESLETNYENLRMALNPPINIDWDWKALLEEPNFFAEESSIIQIGVGLLSTVNVKDRAAEQDLIDVDFFIPSLHLMYERQVWKNLGAGASFSTQIWEVPTLGYQYRYYTLGLRAAYHLNIIDQLDPYIALGTTYRRMVLTNSNRNISESKMTFHIVIGGRYYFTEKIGGHLEIGNDMTSWFKLGLSYYIN